LQKCFILLIVYDDGLCCGFRFGLAPKKNETKKIIGEKHSPV